MSHYVDIITEITDEKALVKALIRMGFTENQIEICLTAQPLVGYEGDQRGEEAHIIIRKKHIGVASNDIGFEKMDDDRYKMHISEFDENGKYNEEWTNKLSTYYNVEKAKMEYDSAGIQYTEDEDEKERPRLRAML